MNQVRLIFAYVICISIVVSLTVGRASAQVTNKKIVNNIINSVIRSAGQVGATELCGYAFSSVLCRALINPIVGVLYRDLPNLRPSSDDTHEVAIRKQEQLIEISEDSPLIQSYISDKLAEFEQRQDAAILEIRTLGKNQEEITRRLDNVVETNRRIEQRLANLEKIVISQNRNDSIKLELLRQGKIFLGSVGKLKVISERLEQNTPSFTGYISSGEFEEINKSFSDFEKEILEVNKKDEEILEDLSEIKTLNAAFPSLIAFFETIERALNIYPDRGAEIKRFLCSEVRDIRYGTDSAEAHEFLDDVLSDCS